MKLIRHLFIPTLLCCVIPLTAFSAAPVVDDSENFAILDDQQAGGNEQPFVNPQQNLSQPGSNGITNDEQPLAHEEPVSKNSVDYLDKVQGMQQEIQELRGQLEVQSHDLKLLQEQQKTFYKDLDARLRQAPGETNVHATAPNVPSNNTLALNQTTTPNTASIAANSDKLLAAETAIVTTPSTNTNPADEQLSYMAAYELIQNKKFDQAIPAMQSFLNKYPHGGYTANAEYWLGELYMVKKDYPNAMQHFNVVLSQYPSSSKSAASLLKLGYALAASGQIPEAKIKLDQVMKKYPDTSTAQLAATKLKSLNTR